MKLSGMNISGFANIRGPQPKNPFGAYFTDEEIELCRKDLMAVLEHFEPPSIRRLIRELQAGRINGSFSETDLIGTLTGLPKGERKKERIELYNRIGRTPGIIGDDKTVRNYFEYWFRQIAGDRTNGAAEQRKKTRNRRRAIRKSIRLTMPESGILRLLEKEESGEASDGRICLFTEITLRWCAEFLSSRRRISRLSSRNGENPG